VSNNPGKRGKPAPWTKRENEERDRAFETYKLAHHAAYAAHSARRKEANDAILKELGVDGINRIYAKHAQLKEAARKLRAWDKKHPSPMTWEEYEALQNEFTATYVAIDRS
jgi:hypothetical protein